MVINRHVIFWKTLTYLMTVHRRNRRTDRITMAIPHRALKCIHCCLLKWRHNQGWTVYYSLMKVTCHDSCTVVHTRQSSNTHLTIDLTVTCCLIKTTFGLRQNRKYPRQATLDVNSYRNGRPTQYLSLQSTP